MECGKSVFIMIAFISHGIVGKERHLKELSFFLMLLKPPQIIPRDV